MTDNDRTWDTRLPKTANGPLPINPLTLACGVTLKGIITHKLGLGGITLARSCFSPGASVG